MTEDELREDVEAFLANHLDASFWSALDESVRSAAVAMALGDVLAELPGAPLAALKMGSFAAKAVAEQAVFLARNYESMSEGKILTSESVEGVSAGYSLLGDSSKANLSFRAAAYLKRAKAALCGATLRVSRG